MPTPKIIYDLVERFDRNLKSYKNGSYNETQVRNEFINPFFEALGWDVINKVGYAEAYKDVIHEYSLKTKDVAKAPDYLFRIGGTKKFFVEAKKPSVNLKDDISPAFQLRRYAWSAKLQLSILTDFEELAIYDCRVQPKKNDKSSTARITYLTYKDYIKKWDEIESIFSKDAVLKGSFDKFAATNKGKRGTTQVDDAFLIEIEKWRELLARNIALRNTDLSNRQLNYSVQKIIDRIIFLRISEDRGIEDYGQFYNLLNGPNTYKKLKQIFTRADEKYNSGLFHFDEEKSRTDPPDEITPTLIIDDKVLKDIFKNLYYPDCPYEFSVLGADILGHVYEQFLGKVIRLTAGHRAIIEEKPEVKKAGGVYYTPTYIVDYIVKNTVGKKLEELEKKHNVILSEVEVRNELTKQNNLSNIITELQLKKIIKEASKIKILDPACGSGSFLLGAYQYLLDWHLQLYTGSVEIQHAVSLQKDSPIYQTKANEYRLTTNEKKRILLNNIYGVDIDNQAVEVTKLSLLLRVLEGETDETLNTQISMFKERALPDLSNNIKCGNSLIAPDFYDQMEMNFLDDEEKLRINVFDWEIEFEEIMKAGGFDCVIGNPPWGADFSKDELKYLRNINSEIIVRMIDSFMYFSYHSSKMLKLNSYWGMILPDVILYQKDNELLRNYLLMNFNLSHTLNMGDVFEKVTRPTAVLILNKTKRSKTVIADFTNYKKKLKNIEIGNVENFSKINQTFYSDSTNNIFVCKNIEHYSLLKRIKEKTNLKLEDIVDDDGIQRGVSPDFKDAFIMDTKTIELHNLEKERLRPVITGGKQVKRYFIDYQDLWLIYNDKHIEVKNYPNIIKYIDIFKKNITCKEVKVGKHSRYILHRARKEKIFTKKKKIVGVITEDEIIVALDNKVTYATDGIYLFGIKPEYDPYYIMSILNSKLFVFIYRLMSLETGRVLAQVKPTLLKTLPIINNNTDLKQPIILKVKSLSELKYGMEHMKTPQEKTALQRQIDATDKQIDKLVYELYGLTEEEIKIIEESF